VTPTVVVTTPRTTSTGTTTRDGETDDSNATGRSGHRERDD
jgi:hypothetical protein